MYKKYIEFYNQYKSDDNIDELQKINEFNKEKINEIQLKNELNNAKKRLYEYVTGNIMDEETQKECYKFINSITEKKTREDTFKRIFVQRYEIFTIKYKNETSTIQFEKYSHTEGEWNTYLYINNTAVEKYCNISNKDKIDIIPLMELYEKFEFKNMTCIRFLFLILNLSEPDVTEYIDSFDCTKLVNNICQNVIDKHIKNMLLINDLEQYEIKSVVDFDRIENENEIEIDVSKIYFRKIKYIHFVAFFSLDSNKLIYTYEFVENRKIVKHKDTIKIENGMCVCEESSSDVFNKIVKKMKLKQFDHFYKIINIIVGVLVKK